MNVHSGVRQRGSVRQRMLGSKFSFLPEIPRDYLARRKLFRTISNVLMIVLFSLAIAGVIVYTSDPSSFGFLRH